MTIPLLLLGAAFLLILANGFFVAAEFGLVTVERPDAEKAAAEGDKRAATVVESLKELSFQLSGTQLGITITSLVVGMLAEPALAELLDGPFGAIGLPAGAVPGIAVVTGMLVASAVQMVLGELVPKNWAVSKPLQVARFVAGPQHVFARLFRPVIAALNTVANRLVRALGVEPADELASARTPGELVSLARHSARAGALEQDTADLFVRTMSLADLTAQHVMTPRVKVSALQSSATAEDVVNLTRATGLSRFPVYRERIDEIVGMVHLKDALAVPSRDRLRTPSAGSPRHRCSSRRRCPCSPSWSGCAVSSRSPSSSTSTAARPVWSPWRTSSRNSSARSATNTTTCWANRPSSRPLLPRTAGPPGTPTAAAGWTSCSA